MAAYVRAEGYARSGMDKEKGLVVDVDGKRERGDGGGKNRGEEWCIDNVRTLGGFGSFFGLAVGRVVE